MFENMYQLLLASEKITITLFDNTTYNLFVWKSENGIGGWLCEPRTYNDVSDRPAKYKLLQSAIGNVIETFAHDHCFDDVIVCGDLPEYTFYAINNAENFVNYIELIAKQWRSYTLV